jgi:septation ring formation regulator
MDSVVLIMTLACIVAIIATSITLYLMQKNKSKKLKNKIDALEIEKNKIDSAPIMPELAKMESYLNNEKLEVLYEDWKSRLEDIKDNQIARVNDMIIDADYSLNKQDYKATLYKIADLEMEIYKVRENSTMLLDEIKGITTSEERNRAIVTQLKAKYRALNDKFTDTKGEYGVVAKPITLQFENISKRFEDFESVMEHNEYTEVTQIIRAIDEMLEHMSVVIDEVPAIILMAKTVLPNQIKEAKTTYEYMVNNGYPLDYLNVEDNIKEANKKINDIITRAKVLNLEDSLFELKILHEYFDGLFNDFEKEKAARMSYEDTKDAFSKRLEKMNDLLNSIFSQLDDIKSVYNMSEDDLNLLNSVNNDVKVLNDDYKTLIDHTGNKTFAYTALVKEIEGLGNRLIAIEDHLNTSLDALGSMKEDEVRARQQLDEIKNIVKDAKKRVEGSNLPVIPQVYYTWLNEAENAISDIVTELNKKPITISLLNTRVDTARDLALKLLSHTKDMLKHAMLAEMGIVYGNRYRSTYEEVDKYLKASEVLFFDGDYTKSLEVTINALNRLEPGIYTKLDKLYNGR